MEFFEQFVPNAVIVVICMLAGIWLKQAFKNSEARMADIPWILGIIGAALGVVGTFVLEDLKGIDILTAMAEGIISGLSACGAYQVIHQQDKLKRLESLKEDDYLQED